MLQVDLDGAPSCFSSIHGLLFRRQFFRRADHFFQQFFKFVEACGWDDDGIVPTGNVLSDAEQPASGIFLEREDEVFTLDLNLAGF